MTTARSRTAGARVGVILASVVALSSAGVHPAEAASVNSVPPNRVHVSHIRCTGTTALVRTGSGLKWPNPDSWKAYSHTTTTTSANGEVTTRMDYWKAAKTYSAFRQCYNGWTRYVDAPETTWTKRYWTQTRRASGGVSVTAGQSGWY